MTLRQTLIQCLAAGAGTLVLVLSWLPDSRMERIPLMPGWLGGWLDQGGPVATLRTGIAMALAAALIHGARWPGSRRGSAAWAAALLMLAEGGQVLLPSRQASVGDLGWGVAGVAVGVGCAHLAITGRMRRRARGASAAGSKGPQGA
mgnify:CR=1 FL=1